MSTCMLGRSSVAISALGRGEGDVVRSHVGMREAISLMRQAIMSLRSFCRVRQAISLMRQAISPMRMAIMSLRSCCRVRQAISLMRMAISPMRQAIMALRSLGRVSEDDALRRDARVES